MAAKKPNNNGAPKRFELPALNFQFGSLTDGTDIPPPPPSPKEEAPKPIVKREEKVEEEKPKKQTANGETNGTSPMKSDMAITTNVGLKRPADDVPASPAPSSRGSLRRLLSRSLLNNAYHEEGSIPPQNISRPPSRTASVIAEEKRQKRSSWFRRLRTGDDLDMSKRTNQYTDEPKKTGPPPPMIPELSALETKIDTNMGDDLFKGIGREA
ncbi:hypothetical protein F5Y16DRAFT_396837 [Xylariaceae sp. FL0255]|nr:hypothetical protein F5Y16DRAFT_396837 [Xylariaceae sp. FL0255]